MLGYVVAEWAPIKSIRMVIDPRRIEELDTQPIKYETNNKSRD
jgi:hypothetical protein